MIIASGKEQVVSLEELQAMFNEIIKQIEFGINRTVVVSFEFGRASILVDGLFRFTEGKGSCQK